VRPSARAGILLLLSAFASGCLVGPDFVPPERPGAESWSSPLEHGLQSDAPDELALARWWEVLGDPVLVELEQRAARANRDVAVAVARLNEARAHRKGARAGLLPSATAGGNVARTRSSGASFAGIEPPDFTRESYDVGFDASWEIDLFGGLRRGVEAARADLAAREADLHGVRVSVAAEVAESYVEVRALQRRIELAEANESAQGETLAIAGWRGEAGLTTGLDVEQALASLEQTRAGIPQLRAALASARLRLAVLVGEPPGALDALLAAPAPVPLPPDRIAVGVPASALARRPDVQSAERGLAAETARVGVATAQQYPRLSLTGSLGVQSLEAAELFTAAARTSSVAGSVAQVLLDFGRVRAQVEAQEAVRERALAQLEQTLLLALEEVEGALVAYAQEQERRSALASAAGAAERAAELSRAQYASGLVDFESVIVAERTLVSSQDQLAASEGACTQNLVRLYKALGGGFESEAVP
jgi:NodT family efflux transporter outer membrane factor (OMF) lipoprotein